MTYRLPATAAVFLFALMGGPAWAGPFVVPFSATVSVNAAASQLTGVSRNSTANGPLADAISEVTGVGSALGQGSVDSFGLHASATVNGFSEQGLTAQARGDAGLVNPFIIVPRAGFTGTTALVEIPYHLGGTLDATVDAAAAGVTARLEVDGLPTGFFFVGGTTNANTSRAIDMGGVLSGQLPLNTELYLRAGLNTLALCQSFAGQSCSASALFGATLTYYGFSSEAVDIVWGLTPTTGGVVVPEPAAPALLAMGIAGLAARRRRQPVWRRASGGGAEPRKGGILR